MARDNLDRRDFDVGPRGLSGHYSTMMTKLRGSLPEAIFILGIWLFVVTVPASVDYRISPHLTVAMIAKLALLVWTIKVWWQIIVALWFGLKWLGLEMRGLQWVVRNDHQLRVIFYRVKDGSLKFDNTPRSARLDQELSAREFRKSSLLKEIGRLALYSVGYFLIPLAFSLAYEVLKNPDIQNFLTKWDAIAVTQWLWFYKLIIPPFVSVGLTIFESFIYATGAQYVPGAKLVDPPLTEKTLETIREEHAHGSADFVSPETAAQQLSQ